MRDCLKDLGKTAQKVSLNVKKEMTKNEAGLSETNSCSASIPR